MRYEIIKKKNLLADLGEICIKIPPTAVTWSHSIWSPELFPWIAILSIENCFLWSLVCSLYLHSASWDAPSVRMGFGIPWVDLLLLLLAEANRTQTQKHIGEHKDYIVGEKELGSLAWNSHLTAN